MFHLMICYKLNNQREKCLKKLLNKILISIVFVSIVILTTLVIIIPQLTEKNTVNLIAQSITTMPNKIKLTRLIMFNQLKDIKEYAPNIKFVDYGHHGVNGVLPFPTTTIHDLSEIFSANTNIQFRFYEFPFKPKQNRVLDAKQRNFTIYQK